MDMTEDNKLLDEFFKESSRMEISDDGFTARVMDSVEGAAICSLRRRSRLWTAVCAVACIVLVVATIATTDVAAVVSSLHSTMASLRISITSLHLSPRIVSCLLLSPSLLSVALAVFALVERNRLGRIGLP